MIESIQVWRQRKVKALHPFQKNKKVRAAKLSEEKSTEGLLAGVWEDEGIQITAEDKNLEGGTTHLQGNKRKATHLWERRMDWGCRNIWVMGF